MQSNKLTTLNPVYKISIENLIAALVGNPLNDRTMNTNLVATFLRRIDTAGSGRYARKRDVVEVRTAVMLQRLEFLSREDREHAVCVHPALGIYRMKVDTEMETINKDEDQEEEEGCVNETSGGAALETEGNLVETFLVCPETLFCERCQGTETCAHIEFIEKRHGSLPTRDAAAVAIKKIMALEPVAPISSPTQPVSPETIAFLDQKAEGLLKTLGDIDLSTMPPGVKVRFVARLEKAASVGLGRRQGMPPQPVLEEQKGKPKRDPQARQGPYQDSYGTQKRSKSVRKEEGTTSGGANKSGSSSEEEGPDPTKRRAQRNKGTTKRVKLLSSSGARQ